MIRQIPILLLLSLSVHAALRTFHFYGTIYASRLIEPFELGKPFTFSVTFDDSVPPTTSSETGAQYPAVRSIRFDYNQGTFVHAVTNVGTIGIGNGSTADSINFYGGGNFPFPALDGKSGGFVHLGLSDRLGEALRTNALPKYISVQDFQQRQLQLTWGGDWGATHIFGAITHMREEAEILQICNEEKFVALTILTPDVPATNYVERTMQLNSNSEWSTIGAFSADTPGEITWFDFGAATNSGSVFYRVRTE